jgi:raffinose/stachyose/melibiose transport system substrate-binding protein
MGKRGSLIVILALVLLSVSIAGCGSSDNGSGTPSSGPGTSSGDAAAKAAPKETIDFEILHYMPEEGRRDAVVAWCDSVKKLYEEKTGNTVNFETNSLTSAQYVTTLKTRISAGDPPDIFWGRTNQYPELIEAGNIMDLSDWDFVKKLDEANVKAASLNDRVYTIPFDKLMACVFYNKDIFAANNLQLPTTQKEFLDIIKYFSDKGQYPFVRGYNTVFARAAELNTRTRPMFSQQDPSFFPEVQEGKRVPSSSPIWTNAWYSWGEVLNFPREDDMGRDEAKQNQLFASGQYPMMVDGTWVIPELRKYNPDLNIGLFPMPFTDDPKDSQIYESNDGQFMVSATLAGTSSEEIAKMYADYMTSDEGIAQWVTIAKTPPALKANVSGTLDPLFAEIDELRANGKVVNINNLPQFTGEMRTRYDELIGEFAAMKDHSRESVKAFVEKVDKELQKVAAKG